jgi:hypothetical protein
MGVSTGINHTIVIQRSGRSGVVITKPGRPTSKPSAKGRAEDRNRSRAVIVLKDGGELPRVGSRSAGISMDCRVKQRTRAPSNGGWLTDATLIDDWEVSPHQPANFHNRRIL